MKCPQHNLTNMQEVILFYNGLDVPTRQILDSKGAIPTKTAANAKGPHYTKDCPLKEEGKTLEEAYYTQFSAPYQPGGQYRAAEPGFYQRNNRNSSYPNQRQTMEESLTKFMAESAKRHKENSNIIKEIRASTDAAIRNQGASFKTLEIQIGQMSKVLQKEDSKETHESKILETYSIGTTLHDYTFPLKEKDPGSFILHCFIHNVYFDKALVDIGVSVSVMPFATYANLGLGDLARTRLTIELADRTIKHPRGITKNVLVRIGKFIFPIDFNILDIPEDDDVLLILGRPFLSTTHAKIDVYKRKITLRVGEEKIVFKSIKPATSIIRRVYMLKTNLDSKSKLIGEVVNKSFDPHYGDYIELNDLDVPLEPRMNQDDNFEPTIKENVIVNEPTKNVDEGDHEGKKLSGTLIDIPIFVGNFSIISGFLIIDDMDVTSGVVLGMPFFKKFVSCQKIMENFAPRDECEQIKDE
ncbi:retrovirus-related pol polyprotein from transposon TNT 1-94 [Tanacetum coccineum]